MISAEELLDRIGAGMVAAGRRAGLATDPIESWLDRNRPILVGVIGDALQDRQKRGLPPPSIVEAPPDEWTAGRRTFANLSAMRTLAELQASGARQASPEAQRALSGYSGWGGLSIDKAASSFPPGIPHPNKAGLIHEYYTPSIVAQAVASMVLGKLDTLPTTHSGQVLALEPSAGIGRFLRYLVGEKRLVWTAVELSELSSLLAMYLYPTVELHRGSFESWAAAHAASMAGRVGLVVANPPYGNRGAERVEDPNRAYSVYRKSIYHYFMARVSDLCARGALMVWLVPAGFMTGHGPAGDLRKAMLLRHHVAGAFRLPSSLFPGAELVTDLVVMRARGGQLPAILPADVYVAEGRYFEAHPGHVLGEVVGSDDGEGKPSRFRRMLVKGTFSALPAWEERPLDDRTALEPLQVEAPGKRAKRGGIAQAAIDESNESDKVKAAIALARRIDAYLAIVASGSTQRAIDLHQELLDAMRAWSAEHGAPVDDMEIRKAEKRYNVLSRLVGAFRTDGQPVDAIAKVPEREALRWAGAPGDVVGQADAWWRDRRSMHLADFAAWHRGLGGGHSVDRLRAILVDAGWSVPFGLKPSEWPNRLEPADVYEYGSLWPKVRAAQAVDDKAWVDRAAEQSSRLMALISPVEFPDIADLDPRMEWVPLELVSQWIGTNRHSGELRQRIRLIRKEGLIQVDGIRYSDLSVSDSGKGYGRSSPTEASELDRFVVEAVGWLNHDYGLWKPRKQKEEKIEVKREEWQREALQSFAAWAGATQERQDAITASYNQANRGFRERPSDPTPFPLARWSFGPRTTPHPWQWAGARRVIRNRGGLVAFDVGVGKTLTGLLVLAAARQEGWSRRPILLVPRSLVWKWAKDVASALPDYRVVVIGSSVYTARGGAARTRTDDVDVMASKWLAYQAGQYDVAVVSYQAFQRIQVRAPALRSYVEQTTAIQREVSLAQERIRATQTGRRPKELTEREKAVLEQGTAGWLAEKLEPPSRQAWVPGVAFEDLGIDLLIVDELQNFKNLYMPSPRGSAGVPKFMGSGGEGSDMAWGLDFRAHLVRQRTGGAGVVGLSATPAKNSPLEFYSVLQYVDANAWSRIGIPDPDTFTDRFVDIQLQYVIQPAGDVEQKPAAVAFKNLDEIRAVLDRYADFQTAESVSARYPERALKLPEPVSNPVTVEMGERQADRYEELRREAARIRDEMRSSGGAPGSGNALAGQLLGVMARMSQCSLHPALADGGWTWKNADGLDPKLQDSAKLQAICERIKRNTACGHIIFCEATAVHRWLQNVIERRGILPAGRIAVLNAEAVPDAGRRVEIAEAFNGSEYEAPKYDVVIANSVAYEGIDLQRRTCAIYHADLPWEPATIQQRNGRGVRQGNTSEVISIDYILSRGSFDAVRFQMIGKKRSWLTTLVESQDRVTNNPGAQQEMSGSEIAAMLASDPAQARKLLDEARQQIDVDRRRNIRLAMEDGLRSASARFRKAEATATSDLERKRLRAEGEATLSKIQAADPEIWPWGYLAELTRETTPFVVRGKPAFPPPPLTEGMRLRVQTARGDVFLEVGPVNGGMSTVLRRAGTMSTETVTLDGVPNLWPPAVQLLRSDVNPASYPAADLEATVKAARSLYDATYPADPGDLAGLATATGDAVWAAVGAAWWARATTNKWTRIGGRYEVAVPFDANQQVDLVAPGGNRFRGQAPMAPTRTGWNRFVVLAKAALTNKRLTYTQLAEAGNAWWGRRLPTGLAGSTE